MTLKDPFIVVKTPSQSKGGVAETSIKVRKKLLLKFVYSEKATKFCEISTLLLTGTTKDKSKLEISKKFVAFSDYMNFKKI